MFPDHTFESAPPAAVPALRATASPGGRVIIAVARLATSPQLLNGFLKLSKLFESTTLEPMAREVVVMTVATRNACHICVAMHTAKLTSLAASPELVAALRDGKPLPDERLEAVRLFTLEVLATAGDVGDTEVRAFLDHGYTVQNALEVVLGIGTYTMSTLANRLTRAPLDEALEPFAWHAA
ncbi:carboxymuconolactone decarboxylase family protein [Amycolatopsis sp. H20-H5]|uniref:carboxymuconolactone decarboxylase family protein n=1 Tax=Amycolatopsis sp. H20-H5 TaxID=3046309 RepID=UPI002DB6C2FB|nr:carboxymuconolactone decarboxylase family protein [Amycolatopsis sp. H20-H5]MEC3979410.1 carboxymuconolactone decarboxylase family protein [Amycolatopsis sp. H20-H5]